MGRPEDTPGSAAPDAETPDVETSDAETASATSGTATRLKSAYELALERLEGQGVERPREDVSRELRERIAEVRRRSAARLAELEILHRDRLPRAPDRASAEDDYHRERRRIEEERERDLARLRRG
jgi:hypothetical protein